MKYKNGYGVSQLSPGDQSTSSVRLPLTRWVILGKVLSELMCAGFRVEVYGEEHLKHAPGALILSNHRRDSDGPILANLLLQRRGWQIHGAAPYFVAREDLFRKGFLGYYLENWPRPVRRLLGGLTLGGLLHGLQVRPIRRIPEHTLGELLSDLHDVLGDAPLTQIFRSDWAEQFAQHLGRPADELFVRHALNAPGELLLKNQAFRRLNRQTLRMIIPFERSVISAQLQEFVQLMEMGETVILEPEGKVSTDGRFQRPRQALHYLLNAPEQVPHVLPVALSYDFMCTGRPRVLVRFGYPRNDLSGLPRRETNEAAQHAVLELWVVSISHLAARYLRRRGAKSLRAELRRDFERFVSDMASQCNALNVPFDQALFESSTREKRVDDCLKFWQRHSKRDLNAQLEFLNNELDAIAAVHPGLFSGDR